MEKEKVLEKIKKCLALSKSANEHEAALALKQAQALMEKHQITDSDVELSKISTEESERRVASRLADWQWDVAALVADVFGCDKYKQGNRMYFYGFGNRPQIAAYAFDVVWRQISAARRNYLRHEWLQRDKAKREYLANRFCEGWLYGARKVVQEFALSGDEQNRMEEYATKTLQIKYVKPKTIRANSSLRSAGDFAACVGAEEGEKLQLHHAVNGADGVKQIGCVP